MLNYILSALASIWSNKVRSFLTLLGVVIGVSSVCILVALGQGLKDDISSIIRGFGSNIMVVVGGRLDQLEDGGGAQINPAQIIASDILTRADLDAIAQVPGVRVAVPLAPVNAAVAYKDRTASPTVVGTFPEYLQVMEMIKFSSGASFTGDSPWQIVLSSGSGKKLFGEEEAVGRSVKLGQYEFVVAGILEKPSDSLLGAEYNRMSFIPYEAARVMNKNQDKIFRIMLQAEDEADPAQLKNTIRARLLSTHGGQEDFSILTQDDLLSLFSKFVSLATDLVAAIAAISLIVGGIGIMNIMLVTVTERTKEIGLRKAVGASKLAILVQFLTEAVVITMLGGLLGVVITFAVTTLVSRQTSLQPVITPSIFYLSIGICTAIGVVFGLWPALRAASKDPIEALRYE